jgi:hypothetical protein
MTKLRVLVLCLSYFMDNCINKELFEKLEQEGPQRLGACRILSSHCQMARHELEIQSV